MTQLAPLISKPVKNVRAKDLHIGDFIICADGKKLRITGLKETDNKIVAEIDYKHEIDFQKYAMIDRVETLVRE